VKNLYSYRDEWVFMQLEDEWENSLKLRRESLDDVVTYITHFRNFKAKYITALDKATKQLIAYHGITQQEQWSAFIFTFKQTLEVGATELLWNYYAFKTSQLPKILSVKEILDAIEVQTKIAEASKDDIKKMIAELDSGEKSEIVALWLGEKMARDTKTKYEDFILSIFDPEKLLKPEVATAKTALKSLYSK